MPREKLQCQLLKEVPMRTKTYFGVYGASGYGREVMPLVRARYSSDDSAEFVFIDDGDVNQEVNGHSVFKYDDFFNLIGDKKAVIAIADSNIRKLLFDKCLKDNIEIISISANNVVVMDAIQCDVGAVLSPFVTMTSNIKIGKGFHANIYSYVAHDCIIGDFVTFAPSVKCNGNVHIEDNAYIGTGAIIKQGTPSKPIVIGAGAVVGMGAVVTKSVPAGDVVFGVPAKSIKRGK